MAQTWSGVLARLGTPTGDGRVISPGALTNRDLPLPLMWQQLSEDGHGGAMVVGSITGLDYSDTGMVTGRGALLDTIPAPVIEQITAGVIGPSVDLDDVDYVVDDQERIVITAGRIAGATLVSIPAFADVSITLDDTPTEPAPADDMDWLYASAAPIQLPPLDWFRRPDLDQLTPLTVSNTGRVFGHIAGWGACHVGLPGCVTAPHSPSGYSYFQLHEQPTADGVNLPTGVLTVGGGHAEAQLAWRPALEHYDNLGTAVARVCAGEDEYGIWVAGWMLPQTTPEQRAAFTASPVSGDWRRIGGELELIAVCSVNAPGFPIPRARVSFSNGGQQSLVASGGLTPITGEYEPVSRPTADATAARARWAWTVATTKERN